jgi:hypothetical protein
VTLLISRQSLNAGKYVGADGMGGTSEGRLRPVEPGED